MVKIEPVYDGKRRFYDLLLQADEQPEMIGRYLDRGEMFVMFGELDNVFSDTVRHRGIDVVGSDVVGSDVVGNGLSQTVAVAVAVVTDEGGGVCELKNLAVDERYRRCGYGRRMLEFLFDRYRGRFERMLVGTGEAPTALPFYEHCGFIRSHRVENFFTDNYDHPIIEAGVRLKDMIYLQKKI